MKTFRACHALQITGQLRRGEAVSGVSLGYAVRMQLAPMQTFEWTLILLTAAVVLTGVARRICVPYPSFLALGGTAERNH